MSILHRHASTAKPAKPRPASTVVLSDDDFRSWLQSEAALLDDEYRPSPDRPFEPDGRAVFHCFGYDLGLAGEDPVDPPGLTAAELRWFHGGLAVGRRTREKAEREELESWLDSIPQPDWDAMDPDFDPLHPIERQEAGPMVVDREHS